jgi:hypothetical protein
MSKLLMVLMMFGIAGCSNKTIYDTLHIIERSKCVKESPPTYFECIERSNKSYEKYERERKESMEVHEEQNANNKIQRTV